MHDFLPLQGKQTALHLASGSGHDKVCQVLLQAGADVQATNSVSIKISTYYDEYCFYVSKSSFRECVTVCY